MRKEVCVLLLAGLAACADKEPAAISVQPLPDPITDGVPHELAATATNKAGERLEGVSIGYAVAPEGIARVENDGTVICGPVGDATLKLTAGEVSTEVPVKCRPVAGVRAPKKVATFLGEGPVPVPATAVAPDGSTLADVPVVFGGYAKDVLEVKDGAIVPVGVGNTKIEASAGGQKAIVEVSVWEKVRSEDVTILRDLQVPLITGRYVVRVNTETPVKLSWKDAPGCEARPAAVEHELTCKLAPEGTLVIENAGKGKPAVGTLDVYRVP